MEAKCGDYVEREDNYDPRGRGTQYYRATCKKCGKEVSYTEEVKRPVDKILLELVCPLTEVARHRSSLEKKINYHKQELDQLTKEYLQSLKEYG